MAKTDKAPQGGAQHDDVLIVRDLKKHFPINSSMFGKSTGTVKAVDGISFTIRRGTTMGLVGESGCGKSTAGRAILRLVEKTSGDVLFNGTDVYTLNKAQMRAMRPKMQIIFQDPYSSLSPRLPVGEIIAEAVREHGIVPKEELDEYVEKIMLSCGLQPYHRERYPHEFSGGQRQRICIARALALNPKVVIADESVSALDVSIQAQIVNLLIDLQRDMGISFLFISHDMAVVERVSHRVAVMYLGQIVEIGPRRAIFENPQHPYTKKLMSAVPIADPARRHMKRTLLSDEIPSPIRKLGDEPVVQPLVQVGTDHFVARHPVGGAY